MYYKVEFLESAKYTEEELKAMMGSQIPVYDAITNELIRYEEFSQKDYDFLNVKPSSDVKVFEAKNAKSLEKQIAEYIKSEIYPAIKIEVVEKKEVDVQELIKEELNHLYHGIFHKFFLTKIARKIKSVDDYCRLKDEYLNTPERFYELIKFENKFNKVEDYLGRYNKKVKIKVQACDYFKRVKELVNSKSDIIGEIK